MFHSFRRFIPVKTKLGVMLGASTLLISGILVAYTIQSTRAYAIQSARQEAAMEANRYAGAVKSDIERALSSVRILAQTLSGVKARTNPLSISRAGANSILGEVLTQNEAFYGAFTCWEPNAFDGADSAFVNADAAHDGSGRFIPYWFKEKNQLLVETFEEVDNDMAYAVPKSTQKPFIMEPMNYVVNDENTVLISISAPILNQNTFYGIVGLDISVKHLQTLLQQQNRYGNQAKITFLSPKGIIAATSMGDTLLGQPMESIFTQEELVTSDLASHEIHSRQTADNLNLIAPVMLGEQAEPWQVVIQLPKRLILAEANALLWKTILISLLLVTLAIVFLVFVIQRLMNPLRFMMEASTQVAEGNLDYTQVKTGNDEIGKMNRALRALTQGLKNTADFANEIGEGNLEAEFTPRGEKDSLGHALLHMRNNLKSIREEDKKREWMNEGLARFSDILRNNNGAMEELANAVLANLIKYLGINQGGIYLIKEEAEEAFLELTATYAWDRKRYKSQRLQLGEGLAGQAVLEKDLIYLTEVPDSYMNITSGLGLANPTAVLIVPLMANEEVVGVLELASFRPFEKHHISFIQKIGESIAASIHSAQINQSTRQLLEEAHQSAEQLRSAEEELKQNQEEIMATQEEMNRTISSLRKENEELNDQLQAALQPGKVMN